jgi:hypothetical protein
MSPDLPEVAFFTPVVPANLKDRPGHWPTVVSLFDYRRQTKTESAPGTPTSVIFGDSVMLFDCFRFSPNGRLVLAHDGEGVLHIFGLSGPQPREVETISLGLSGARPNFQPVDVEWSPDSARLAIIFSFKVFHEGDVRVYDVSTGHLEWERSFHFVEMGGEAWSPDGRRLAVTLLTGEPSTAYPPRAIPNLLVFDANWGGTILSVDTGDQAGPLCFAPDDTLATAPLHFEPYGTDRWHHEKAKVWNATTGKLVRQIASPGRDIHDHLALSRNGKVLVAYVGKERAGFSFRAMEYTSGVLDSRFQLFDYNTGRVIATSPELGCASGWFAPDLRIGPDGRRVLVSWPHLTCSATVYELP